jgi:hypothetical protein
MASAGATIGEDVLNHVQKHQTFILRVDQRVGVRVDRSELTLKIRQSVEAQPTDATTCRIRYGLYEIAIPNCSTGVPLRC